MRQRREAGKLTTKKEISRHFETIKKETRKEGNWESQELVRQ